MRAVLVGCGGMSRVWLENSVKLGIEIVGLVDIDLANARKRAEELAMDGVLVTTDLADALEIIKPDVVFDVVIPKARHEVVSISLGRGCHVLSEKPMAASMAEARDLIRRAKEANRIHAVVQNRRYIPQVRRIRRLIESGVIGNATSIHCDFFLGPHFGGFRETMDHVLLLDMAIHTFDCARYFAGVDAKAVYCKEWNPPNSWFRYGASATAIFEMEGGAVFNYRGSWCAEGLMTSWESSWRIVCERGTLSWDGFEDIRAEVATADGFFSKLEAVEIPPLSPNDRVDGHLGVMQDFVDAVNGGKTPETVGYENIKSLAMVFGAIESANKGERVSVRP